MRTKELEEKVDSICKWTNPGLRELVLETIQDAVDSSLRQANPSEIKIMTDEQIDNLQPGRELDGLIAHHVFGLTPLTELECNIILEWEARRGQGGIPCVESLFRDDQNQIRRIGRYSTEIRDAWDIVDLWLYRHPLVMTFRPGPKDWWVIFSDECGHPEGSRNHGKNCFREAFGTTSALAICRCALKMTMEEK